MFRSLAFRWLLIVYLPFQLPCTRLPTFLTSFFITHQRYWGKIFVHFSRHFFPFMFPTLISKLILLSASLAWKRSKPWFYPVPTMPVSLPTFTWLPKPRNVQFKAQNGIYECQHESCHCASWLAVEWWRSMRAPIISHQQYDYLMWCPIIQCKPCLTSGTFIEQ